MAFWYPKEFPTNFRTKKEKNLITWLFFYLIIFLFDYLIIWLFDYFIIWLFQYLIIWLLNYLINGLFDFIISCYLDNDEIFSLVMKQKYICWETMLKKRMSKKRQWVHKKVRSSMMGPINGMIDRIASSVFLDNVMVPQAPCIRALFPDMNTNEELWGKRLKAWLRYNF